MARWHRFEDDERAFVHRCAAEKVLRPTDVLVAERVDVQRLDGARWRERFTDRLLSVDAPRAHALTIGVDREKMSIVEPTDRLNLNGRRQACERRLGQCDTYR